MHFLYNITYLLCSILPITFFLFALSLFFTPKFHFDSTKFANIFKRKKTQNLKFWVFVFYFSLAKSINLALESSVQVESEISLAPSVSLVIYSASLGVVVNKS